MKTHTLNLPLRTVTLTIDEQDKEIYLSLEFSKVGPLEEFNDFRQFREWYMPLIKPYDADPRPFVMRNPVSGERAIVFNKGILIMDTDA